MTKWRKWRLPSKQDRYVWKCKHQHSQCGDFMCVSPDCYTSLSDLRSLLFLFMSSTPEYKFTSKYCLFYTLQTPFFYWSYDVEMYPYSFWGENGHITLHQVRWVYFFYSNPQEICFVAEIRVGHPYWQTYCQRTNVDSDMTTDAHKLKRLKTGLIGR